MSKTIEGGKGYVMPMSKKACFWIPLLIYQEKVDEVPLKKCPSSAGSPQDHIVLQAQGNKAGGVVRNYEV